MLFALWVEASHQEIGGNLYCTVEVWDKEKQQWIAKQDVDTESYTEKEKGQASDSFKRACVNWGIGRELYSAPFIWIPAEKAAIRYDGKRYTTSEHFRVSAIGYDSGREINALEICNSKGFTVFRMQAKKEASAPKKMKNMPEEVKAQLSEKMRADLQKELNRTGIPVEQVLARYHLDEAGTLSGCYEWFEEVQTDCCSLTGVKGIAKMSIEELIQMILGERINSALQETSLERDKG